MEGRKFKTIDLETLQIELLAKAEELRFFDNHDTSMFSADMKVSLANAFKRQAEEKREVFRKLNQIIAPMKGVKPVDFHEQEAATVIMSDCAITSAKSVKTVIGTYGASLCIIFALYDSKNRVALLAHVDALSDITYFQALLRHFNLPTTVAHLYGGTIESIKIIQKLMDFLENNNIRIINAEVMTNRNSNQYVNLAINASNGYIYTDKHMGRYLDVSEAIQEKIRLAAQRTVGVMTESYNGLKAAQLVYKPLPEENERPAVKEPKDFFSAMAAEEREVLRSIDPILGPMQGAKPVDFKKTAVITVSMDEYAITSAKSIKPVIGTNGALTCLILALYDAQNHIALLAHIAALTDIEPLQAKIRHFNVASTVAHLCGGEVGSAGIIKNILAFLKKNNITLRNVDVMRKKQSTGACLAINAINGHIYIARDILAYLDTSLAFQQRLALLSKKTKGFKLSEYYNGLESSQLTQPSPEEKANADPDVEITHSGLPYSQAYANSLSNFLGERLVKTAANPCRIFISRAWLQTLEKTKHDPHREFFSPTYDPIKELAENLGIEPSQLKF